MRSFALLTLVLLALLGPACGDDDGTGNHTNQNHTLPVCGNGTLEGTEECDLAGLNSDTAPDTCRTDCRNPRCGDGTADPGQGEACDRGIDNSDTEPDACRTSCQLASCGDGVTDPLLGETCDDGNTDAGDGCGATCLIEACGDGIVNGLEVCDDGNTVSGDDCSADCLSDETCGNGYVDGVNDEQCDAGEDNSTAANAACRPDCTVRRCGDGVVDGAFDEICDDGAGNRNAPDACRPTCVLPACGDGIVDSDELCDDGDTTSGDGCSADCQSDESCGNGIVDAAAGETCDAGGANANTPDAPCRTTCRLPRCGDGVTDPGLGETCDDGNAADGDGCSAVCAVELHYDCTTAAPSVCTCTPPFRGAGCQECAVFVDATPGLTPRNGGSWATAFAGLPEAASLAASTGTGCDVWVAAGTYTLTDPVFLHTEVEVYGGFTGTETARTQRDAAQHPTVIVPSATGATVIVDNASRAVLDGLRFQGGGTGERLSIASSEVTITDCTFTGLRTRATSPGGPSGGALRIASSTVAISGCRFEANQGGDPQHEITTSGFGGALYLEQSTVTIADTDLLDNELILVSFPEGMDFGFAQGGGGALAAIDSDLLVERSSFAGNRIWMDNNFSGASSSEIKIAATGGALHAESGSTRVRSSTFSDNRIDGLLSHDLSPTGFTGQGGAIHVSDASLLELTDLLLTGNRTYSVCRYPGASDTCLDQGGGVHAVNVTQADLRHLTLVANWTEIWRETSTFGVFDDLGRYESLAFSGSGAYQVRSSILRTGGISAGSTTHSVTYSNVEGGYAGTGNLDADPLFVAADDFHLRAGSPCIDAADDAAATTGDLEGHARYDLPGVGTAVADMGALEYQGACGDGYEQPARGETCDDGNLVDGDGCSATCQSEGGGPLITEYVEGTSNNKALEITNLGLTDLPAGSAVVDVYVNGGSSPLSSITLSFTALARGESWVVCNLLSGLDLQPRCDQLSALASWNGDDAVALVVDGTIVDVMGQIGFDPGSAWTAGGVTTLDRTLRRMCSVVEGDPIGSDAFDPSLEWTELATDTFDGLGVHCP